MKSNSLNARIVRCLLNGTLITRQQLYFGTTLWTRAEHSRTFFYASDCETRRKCRSGAWKHFLRVSALQFELNVGFDLTGCQIMKHECRVTETVWRTAVSHQGFHSCVQTGLECQGFTTLSQRCTMPELSRKHFFFFYSNHKRSSIQIPFMGSYFLFYSHYK